tara:strand:- start:186 stop:1397 length:1212 start_codon:yes stop_codon:yes gene_type:complete
METTEALRPVALVVIALLAGGVTLGTLIGQGADRFADYEPVLAREAAPGPALKAADVPRLAAEALPDLQPAQAARQAAAPEAPLTVSRNIAPTASVPLSAPPVEAAAVSGGPADRVAPEIKPSDWIGALPSDRSARLLAAPPTDGDARQDWRRYAVRVAAAQGRPRIAIVLDDLGLNRAGTRTAIKLPGPLTLAFMTYAEDLTRQTQSARQQGHELLVHVPMEAERETIDDKYRPLKLKQTPDELQANLDWGLGRFKGFVGINNHMGSLLTQNRPAMTQIIQTLKARGLLFLDSRTSGRSLGVRVAEELGVPNQHRDVFLDHIPTDAFVAQQLDEVERLAVEYGQAIAIGHPRDATLAALKTWLPRMKAKGYQLVPISALIEAAEPLQLSVLPDEQPAAALAN